MVVFIQIVSRNWFWLSLLCLLLGLVFLRQAGLAKREAKYSIFGLEREQALHHASRARNRAVTAFLIAILLYGLSTRVVPSLPLPEVEDRQSQPTAIYTVAKPTATFALARLSPPPGDYSPPLVTTATGTPVATAGPTSTTTAATPTTEATATVAPAPRASCPNPGVQITSPGMGATVRGSVTIMGVAAIENFQFYKVEVSAGEQPSGWTVITDIHKQAVTSGQLDTWDTSPYPAGVYWLQLVVVDQTGNYPAPCAIRVVLEK